MTEKNIDKLDIMFESQQKFFNNFFDFDSKSIQYKEQATKDMLLHLIAELMEVLNEINWKSHVKKRKNINIDFVHEEIIDAFHFLINIALIWNLNSKTTHALYIKKTAKNYKRFLK